jgi:hypothetical protein
VVIFPLGAISGRGAHHHIQISNFLEPPGGGIPNAGARSGAKLKKKVKKGVKQETSYLLPLVVVLALALEVI